MKHRKPLIAILAVIALAGAPAFAKHMRHDGARGGPAQQNRSGAAPQSGSTTGPAAGAHVAPSTVVEKQNPHIGRAMQVGKSDASGMSAGAPGVEGAPGTQSGR